MGDEKRHVDHLEEAAHKAEADLRDDLEKAVEFEKADVAETHREWHDQLHNDHAELVADVARDKEEIREALDDARHPERIVHAAEEKLAHAAAIKAYAEEKLLALDGVVRIGDGTAPHILSISLVGYPSANVVTELGAQGICISAGSACHRGQLSHVYRAMGLDKKTAAGVLRVSFGPETTKEEIDALVSALKTHRDTRFPML